MQRYIVMFVLKSILRISSRLSARSHHLEDVEKIPEPANTTNAQLCPDWRYIQNEDRLPLELKIIHFFVLYKYLSVNYFRYRETRENNNLDEHNI